MASQAGKDEFVLQFSDTNSIETMTGPEADARRIRNVLFGHGRAGDFKLGIDIQSNLFEFGDSKTLERIASDAREAIGTYCKDVDVKELTTAMLPADQDPTGRNNVSLVIAISIGTPSGAPYDFALVATKTAKKTVISTLVL
jgi:hypothetical protein